MNPDARDLSLSQKLRLWNGARLRYWGPLSSLAACLLWCAPSAQAGGSLPFSEAMAFAEAHQDLEAALVALVTQEKADPDRIVCTAMRLGNHWTHLGGARVLPFECEIGKRTIVIEGKVEFLDGKGTVIGSADDAGSDLTEADFKAAKKIRMSKPAWTTN